MLTYVIVINDNGKTEIINDTEVRDLPITYDTGTANGDIEAVINEILDTRTNREEAKPEIVEMRLCEQHYVLLKPDVTYRFTVDPNCDRCKELARKAKPDV